MIQKLINKIASFYYKSSSERFCVYLRNKGVKIGSGVSLRPKTFNVDLTRPSLISIGDNCYFNENFTLLTHDWVALVFIQSNRDFLNSSGKVVIGNNVSFGQNVMVLKGASIGDNSFIGAGSIVTGSIPANSIAVGIPCKVIMTLEEYYQKRKQRCESEALEYALSIKDRLGRTPVPSDFHEEFIWFVSGNEVCKYPEIPIKAQLGDSYDRYVKEHRAKYDCFDSFLRAAELSRSAQREQI